MPSLVFHRAVPEHAEALTALAHASKRHWGYPDAWMHAWRSALTFTSDFIRRHHVVEARAAGTLAGVYALAFEDEECTLEHFWVAPTYMGRGVGRRMLRHAARSAVAFGARHIRIESDPNAEGFYRRLGARTVGMRRTSVEGHPRLLPLLVLDLRPRARRFTPPAGATPSG